MAWLALKEEIQELFEENTDHRILLQEKYERRYAYYLEYIKQYNKNLSLTQRLARNKRSSERYWRLTPKERADLLRKNRERHVTEEQKQRRRFKEKQYRSAHKEQKKARYQAEDKDLRRASFRAWYAALTPEAKKKRAARREKQRIARKKKANLTKNKNRLK